MSGRLLTDIEIAAAIEDGHLKVTGLTQTKRSRISMGRDSQVQPSSLDLRVGLILLPPEKEFDLGKPRSMYPPWTKGDWIAPGMTVVVETFEEISLDSSIAAFGFPPAHLARNAILMTNPGHIDPGYSGKLSFTLINMGRHKVAINQGDPILTLLIFKFDTAVQADYAGRRAGKISAPDYWKCSML
jgi:deoxycytidine triphosphate deaminase